MSVEPTEKQSQSVFNTPRARRRTELLSSVWNPPFFSACVKGRRGALDGGDYLDQTAAALGDLDSQPVELASGVDPRLLEGIRFEEGGVRIELLDQAADRPVEEPAVFDRLGARGTLRIALKIAGLTAKSVTAGQLCVLLEKVMPDELEKRGVSDAAVACSAVIDDLANTPDATDTPPTTNPDEVFRRLAGG